jgi:predicted protein tyrosine phosphatase
MFIENVAAADVPKGEHFDAGENSMLIQIGDTGDHWWPAPKFQFKEIHQFRFLDIEHEDKNAITDEQAQKLVALLQYAFVNEMNIVVNCMAGICRSGAVTEIGVMLGFEDTKKFRSPNLRVKHKMMDVLGWRYNADEVRDWRNVVQDYFQHKKIK